MGDTINLVNDHGEAITVSTDEAANLLTSGSWRAETGADVADRAVENVREDLYGGAVGTGVAAGAGVLRGVTGGLSDAALAGLGHGDALRKFRETNQTASLVGEIGGSVLPVGVGGLAVRAGARAGRVAEGASITKQITAAARGAAVEGGIQGVGTGISELALSEDPLTVERVASVLGSNALFGAGAGAVVGGAGKGIEKGLRLAKNKLDDIAAKGASETGDVTGDLANLDRKGLRAAEKAEMDAIEAARVPQRAELADEIKAFRQELKENKVWLATQGSDDAAVSAIGKRTFKADKALDNILDDPKALAESPKAALKQLRVQEAALDDLVTKHADNLRTKFAGDTSGERAAALDFASVALERNRSLQTKIAEVSAKPTSARLDAIADAMAGGATKKAGGGLGDMIGDSALGYAVGAAAGVPILGQVIAAARVGGGLLKKLGADSAAVAARGSKAIGTFLDASAKVAPQARVLATKTLASVSYGELADNKPKRGKAQPKGRTQTREKAPMLADSYKARSEEIRSLTAPGPDGNPVMRPEARAKIAAKLAPVAAADPKLADMIETNKARAVEFLAKVLPRKPDLPGMDGNGWQPSDMEMRTWARHVAAVEDPHGVVERLASGEVTPEDAEVMREVYPEMYADIQAQIMVKMGELRAKLPYQRRLALSVFSGVPIDPALDPRVLGVLQASFANEEGTSGGVEAPRAQPAFGSVTKPAPTPAQERSA